MQIQENIPLGRKTTMRIGGNAKYFMSLETREDVEQAFVFAREKHLPLIVLGGGSNTVFADGTINALVVQVANQQTTMSKEDGRVTVGCGKALASLVSELANAGFDLSALTGIPGTIGGAIVGNAGQGPKGIWIDSFIEEVTAFIDGKWQTLKKDDCRFSYRESVFKHMKGPVVLWEAVLHVPAGDTFTIMSTVDALLQKRMETQPHTRTAGSCFKAMSGETPAWKLIDAAGLKGFMVGDVQIADKHANFLLNMGSATYMDARTMVETIRRKIDVPLEVEMRFIEPDGSLAF